MAADEIKGEDQVDVQKRYIMAKINELIDGVGPGYGETLLGELITRMERTVGRFHEEVTELLDTLKARAEERNGKLISLKSEKEGDIIESSEEPVTSAEQEISDWEKRLESKEKKVQVSAETGTEKPPEEKEEPKKKGFFKRKKK